MRHAALAPTFLTSLLVHMTGLLGMSLLWGALHVNTSRPDPYSG
jgi:hypothetical protein